MTLKILQADLFSKSNVGVDLDYKNLLEQINQSRWKETTNRTNDGCWRSVTKYNFDWLLDEVKALANIAILTYSELDSVFADEIKDKQFSINYWTNVNSPNSRNVMHSHVDSCLSCVYYIQGTDTGSLRLINPANILTNCNPAAPFTRDRKSVV